MVVKKNKIKIDNIICHSEDQLSGQGVVRVSHAQYFINVGFLIIFFMLISLPLISSFLPININIDNREKRVLASKPKLMLSTVLFFPQAFEAFYNDHFPFRNIMIRWNSILKIRIFKDSPVPSKVIIGKKGWLFYAAEGALDNFKRTQLFSGNELKMILHTVENRKESLKRQGVAYYLVFTPEKQTIYPELMPDSIVPVNRISKLDQVIGYLREHSSVKIIDARDALFTEKNKHILFRRIDTHWNQYGAFISSVGILRAIVSDFPVIRTSIPSEDDFIIESEVSFRGDLTDMLFMENNIFSDRVPRMIPKDARQMQELRDIDYQEPLGIEKLVIREVPDSQLPRLVMFRDSFASALVPFLSTCFSRSVYVWSFYHDLGLIAREKPNIVINEVNERYLYVLIH